MIDNETRGIESRLIDLADGISEVRDTHRELITERDQLIIILDDHGYTKTDIASIAGITYQQVQQIVSKGKR